MRSVSIPTMFYIRKDYGEERTLAIGVDEGNYFVVVSTRRGENRRLISAWKAGQDEKEKYHKTING